ncbi:hypothetical protein JGU71_28415 [Antrihabitans sp. YC3-6]|uniref:Uncharacterized protein n=2 Tax=Antrihabitans stalagmiti TaxID=2799499 RepID=A0A934NWF5_9NOCA|nr:hypothetical protein [Antrihabitans stalagmiti]MBJ8342821.1 hypothetical protein [Antrihabitans stalagmiti]
MAEIYEHFVQNAPFRERRELIFRALTLHADMVANVFSNARLWVDGGFVTHKSWAEPEDADVVVVVPQGEIARATEDKNLPLSTMQGVLSTKPSATTPKLHPMGGLLDVFIQPDVPVLLDPWHRIWSLVRDASGTEYLVLQRGIWR